MPAERHPLPRPALHPSFHPASHRGLQRRLLILAAAALPGLALAQKWPAQPVRIVVPYTAGGGSDNIARALGTELSRELGQPVVVDNKPGASAMLGAELVARAAPDGYTLLLADMPHTITPSLYKTPYDALKDFTPVALIGSSPLVLAVNPKLKAQSVKEYIAMARARPGQINFASGGTGTATHLAGELFKQQTDTFITHIPYKGSGQAVADVVAGHTESMFSSAPTVIPHIKSGALRALATTGAQRSPALPQVPTMAESGVRGLTVLHWFGLLAPARLPPGIQTALHDAVARAMATRPRLLLLDEVTGGVDQRSIPGLVELVRGLRRDGVTLIVIEHNMQVLMSLADRVVALHLGAKIAEGTPGEIQRDPRVVESYLGAAYA
ncbi:MAG: tripartite tricarboxylate transporter substrate binding protein [Delftia sp.]|nr:tripartite tricarboxylate transporter substrate binding protein [Delftia sp.]